LEDFGDLNKRSYENEEKRQLLQNKIKEIEKNLPPLRFEI
jgi:hypothetical protein